MSTLTAPPTRQQLRQQMMKCINWMMIDKLEIHTHATDNIIDHYDPDRQTTVLLAKPTLQHEVIWEELTTKIQHWQGQKRSQRNKGAPGIQIAEDYWTYEFTKQYIPSEPAHIVLKNQFGIQLWIMRPGHPSEAAIRLVISPIATNHKCLDEIYTEHVKPIELAFGITATPKRWKTERIDLATDAIFRYALTPGMISVDANNRLGDCLITHATFDAENGEPTCKPAHGKNYRGDKALNPNWSNDRKAKQLACYAKDLYLVGQPDKVIRCIKAGFTEETIGQPLMKYIMGFGPKPTDEHLLRWEFRMGTDWLHERKFWTLHDLTYQMDRLIAEALTWRMADPSADQTRSRWKTADWWDQLMRPSNVQAEAEGAHNKPIAPEAARLRQLLTIDTCLNTLEQMGTDMNIIQRFIQSPAKERTAFATTWAQRIGLALQWTKPRIKQFLNAHTAAKRDAGPDIEYNQMPGDEFAAACRAHGLEWWKSPVITPEEIAHDAATKTLAQTEPFKFSPDPTQHRDHYYNLSTPTTEDGYLPLDANEAVEGHWKHKPTFNWKVKPKWREAGNAAKTEESATHAGKGAGIPTRPEKPDPTPEKIPLYTLKYEHRLT